MLPNELMLILPHFDQQNLWSEPLVKILTSSFKPRLAYHDYETLK